MADLEVEGNELVLHLRAIEKAEGVHGDIRLPLSAVTAVRSVDDPWPELRGIRAPGTGLPNVIAVGTRRGKFGKDFAAVHGKGPAVVVELEGADYGRLVVTADDAAARASSIAQGGGEGLTGAAAGGLGGCGGWAVRFGQESGQESVQGGWKLMERATSRWVTKPTTRSSWSTGSRDR